MLEITLYNFCLRSNTFSSYTILQVLLCHITSFLPFLPNTVNILYTLYSTRALARHTEFAGQYDPPVCVEAFGNRVAAIVDCFELFIERPSNLHARAQTFSHYKPSHTMKYLISITLQGSISLISKGWGGRTSDTDY